MINYTIPKQRNNNIDFARGIAILIMVCANSAPYFLDRVQIPLILRFLFSTAAPIFIFLSGYSLALSFNNGKTVKQNLKRAFQILFIAILIDIAVWSIIPFQTFDVLYLIGFSQIGLILIYTKSTHWKIGLFILTLIIYFFVLSNLNYSFKIIENEFSLTSLNSYRIKTTLKRLLFDGWFPILPWFSISLAGYLAQIFKLNIKTKKIIWYTGLILIIVSYIIHIQFSNFIIVPREKYLELFYPVTIPFLLYLAGLLIMLTQFIRSDLKFNSIISSIGKFSLSVYLFHTILINFIISRLIINTGHQAILFAIICILFISIIIIFCKTLTYLKPILIKHKIGRTLLFFLGL